MGLWGLVTGTGLTISLMQQSMSGIGAARRHPGFNRNPFS
jgi:hypothetical protein